jgi:hypothetical protein
MESVQKSWHRTVADVREQSPKLAFDSISVVSYRTAKIVTTIGGRNAQEAGVRNATPPVRSQLRFLA